MGERERPLDCRLSSLVRDHRSDLVLWRRIKERERERGGRELTHPLHSNNWATSLSHPEIAILTALLPLIEYSKREAGQSPKHLKICFRKSAEISE